MRKALYVLMLLAAQSNAQTVEGSVFNAATGTAAGGVTVELLRGTTPFYETVTDGGGRFRFDDIKEGDYSVRYQSPDYWLTAGPTNYQPFPVLAGSPVKLAVRLMPWSKISGRVMDARGKGVPKAQLELTGTGMLSGNRMYLRTSWGGGGGMQLGGRAMMSFGGATDAEGRFSVQLMPGAYGLSVTAPPDLKPPEPQSGDPRLAWTRTYYPGVSLTEAASKIVVLAGGEVSDVELKLLAVPAHIVRGVVLDPEGAPAAKVPVLLGEDLRASKAETAADGTFEFDAVPEAEWHVVAQVQRDGVLLRATDWLEVTKHDMEGLKLRLVPPITLRGKVVMEGNEGPPLPRISPMNLALSGGRTNRDGDLRFMMGSGPINPDASGSFVTQAYPGMYHLSPMMQPPPAPFYLDSVQVGDLNLTWQEAEFPASDVEMTVLYKSDGGTLRGTAEHCASGGVLLVPHDPLLRRTFSRSGACDPKDHYEVRAVRPGEYYAVALAGNAPVPPVDEALLNEAVKVTVRSGEVTPADVHTITRPVF